MSSSIYHHICGWIVWIISICGSQKIVESIVVGGWLLTLISSLKLRAKDDIGKHSQSKVSSIDMASMEIMLSTCILHLFCKRNIQNSKNDDSLVKPNTYTICIILVRFIIQCGSATCIFAIIIIAFMLFHLHIMRLKCCHQQLIFAARKK